ncbi:unnamed protein product [Rotaria sp. Silwood1]|nr:unnamed protein product [Rotaria sp. Silwood1]
MTKRIQKPTITVSTDINGNQDINITNDENNMTIEETYHDKEKQTTQDLTIFLESILGQNTLRICSLKQKSLISALGYTLLRVYFNVIDEEGIVGNDCIY